MTNILIQRDLSDEDIKRLEEKYKLKVHMTDGEEFPAKDILYTIEVYVGWEVPKVIDRMPDLKWIHVFSAGVDDTSQALRALDTPPRLTNNRGTYAVPLTEHSFALLLAVLRKINKYTINQAQKKWEYEGKVKEINSSTIGIVGFGDVGKYSAKISKAFGAKVLVHKINKIEKPDYVDQVYYGDKGLNKMLPLCDYILISLPGTKSTKHLFDKNRMLMMKKGAVIVNVGRGYIIDCEALCDLIEQGHIAGAGLDVTDPEPLNDESGLWSKENVVITPHMAGSSPNGARRTMQIFEKNLESYLKGETMPNEIDVDRGY